MALTITTSIPSDGYLGSDRETLSVPSTGPFSYTCPRLKPDDSNGFGEMLSFSSGLLVAVSLKKFAWSTGFTLSAVPPLLELQPGDEITVSYTALNPPTIVHWAH